MVIFATANRTRLRVDSITKKKFIVFKFFKYNDWLLFAITISENDQNHRGILLL